jgi:hypothetical protein
MILVSEKYVWQKLKYRQRHHTDKGKTGKRYTTNELWFINI